MDIINVDLVDAMGNPAVVTVATDADSPVRLTLFTAVRCVLWNMPTVNMTIEDAELGRSVLRQLLAAERDADHPAVWEAADEVRHWTLVRLRLHAPRIFGINAIAIVEAFEQ